MLEITIPATDLWDDELEEFIPVKECTLLLEHSLISVSKWESKWHKAFMTKNNKTHEEIIDYVRCMTLTKNVDENVYYALTDKNISQIQQYIDNPMSATIINKPSKNGKTNNDVLTSEVIYYYMIAAQIPFECEKWHLNRLIKLIEVCGIKNEPPKKMSRGEILSRNRELNAKRKMQLNTTG